MGAMERNVEAEFDCLTDQRENAHRISQDISSTTGEGYEVNTVLIPSKPIIYKRRWLMLFIFAMNMMMNGALFMSLAPISNIAVKYYDVHPDQIEWLSNIFMLAYIFLGLPASYCITRFGIRPMILSASGLHILAAVLHYAGHHKDRFWLVLVGQTFPALAYCMILQMPGKLSSLWFPQGEVATATSVGMFMNLFGVGVGFLQSSMMVKESLEIEVVENGLRNFYLSRIIMSAVAFLLTIPYKEKPPTPPCYNIHRESFDFCRSVKQLCREKYFVILSHSYGIYFGLFFTFSVLVNPMVTSRYPDGYDEDIGWMGFWSNLAGIIACLLIALLIDKFRVHRLAAFLLNFTSMLLLLAFVLVLTKSKDFTALFVLYVFLGVSSVPYFAIGIEQAAEITYPVSEETSSAIILILGNTYGFIFILVLGFAAEKGYISLVGYVMVSLYLISSLLAAFVRTELKRLMGEKQAIGMNTSNIETDTPPTLNDSLLVNQT